ncbi:MAG: hypothetical protein J5911_02130 [Clostridia bacterium]|nr:hypothetical protein [Clostridia bacterium]
MSNNYEGKLGVGQLIFCLFAFATLLIPLTLDPSLVFAFNEITPIGTTSGVALIQTGFITALFDIIKLSSVLTPEILNLLPYSIYAFYAIVAFDLVFGIILMMARVESLRIILKVISVLLGFVMLAVTIISLMPVVGFFAQYFSGAFGEALIIDCIKNTGIMYFFGFMIFSLILMICQFSSFFGKSY